jgi:cysteine-rich repeat protein
MRSLIGIVLVATTATALAAFAPASSARAQNAKAHKGAAERAIVKERWCEAVFLYSKLDDVDPNPEWALQAADAAQFADDRGRAVALYKSALARAPKHPRARAMEQSISALEKLIGKSGNGTACGMPTPECGNGVVEGSETCDDGNRSAGDSCPATCTGTSQSAKPVTGLPSVPVVVPPVVPVVPVKPVVTTPPPPPPVVVAPPPPPPKVTPPPPPPPPPPTATLPVQRSDPSAGGATLCTIIKPVKAFVKGDWKTFEFGSTLTIKSTGPQWTMIETPNGDQGKVAASVMEGACGKEEPAPGSPTTTPAPAATSAEKPETPVISRSPEPIKFDDGSGDDENKRDVLDDPPETKSDVTEKSTVVDAPDSSDSSDDEDKEPDTRSIEPLRNENEPAAIAPEVEEAEGGGIGGWLVLGAGALFTAGGATAAVWGALPYFEYTGLCQAGFGATNCPALSSIGEDYSAETDPEDRANLADDAADLRQDVDNAAQAWDEGSNGGVLPTGRFVMAGGIGAAGLGVGLMVTGLIIALSGGEGEDVEEEESE